MHWVVTTGDTVDEARARALDALGIDEDDLEFEVLAEAGSSLFGLRRTPARVRARVRPTRPRPKVDRRQRRKQSGRKRNNRARGSKTGGGRNAGQEGDSQKGEAQGRRPRSRNRKPKDTPAVSDEAADRAGPPASATGPAAVAAPSTPEPSSTNAAEATTGADMSDISLDEQEPAAIDFLEGLLEAFDADASVEASRAEDDGALELEVSGDDLGLLVGPRGSTLQALQELTRTAVAQQHSGRLEGRLRVDVAGYRARRREALARFATQQAEKVRETGEAVALEPMAAPDRKVVHDTVNELDGVATRSEGDDRRRHVVIHPDD